MGQTFGIGISVSAGDGVEVAIQRAMVLDGATGEWYFAETYFSGINGSVLPGMSG
jgi:hypothetical protein